MDPSVSVHLALLLIADRLADECSLDVGAEIGPRACRSSLRLGLGRAFFFYRKPSESEHSSLRGCLMAMLQLFRVWQLTVSDPF